MSRSDQAECRATLLRETPLAILVRGRVDEFWFPRAQIGYMRKDTAQDGTVTVVFSCPEWLVESKNAWEIVP